MRPAHTEETKSGIFPVSEDSGLEHEQPRNIPAQVYAGHVHDIRVHTVIAARWARGFSVCDASCPRCARLIRLSRAFFRFCVVLIVLVTLREVKRLTEIADDSVHVRHAEIWDGEARQVVVGGWIDVG